MGIFYINIKSEKQNRNLKIALEALGVQCFWWETRPEVTRAYVWLDTDLRATNSTGKHQPDSCTSIKEAVAKVQEYLDSNIVVGNFQGKLPENSYVIATPNEVELAKTQKYLADCGCYDDNFNDALTGVVGMRVLCGGYYDYTLLNAHRPDITTVTLKEFQAIVAEALWESE